MPSILGGIAVAAAVRDVHSISDEMLRFIADDLRQAHAEAIPR